MTVNDRQLLDGLKELHRKYLDADKRKRELNGKCNKCLKEKGFYSCYECEQCLNPHPDQSPCKKKKELSIAENEAWNQFHILGAELACNFRTLIKLIENNDTERNNRKTEKQVSDT